MGRHRPDRGGSPTAAAALGAAAVVAAAAAFVVPGYADDRPADVAAPPPSCATDLDVVAAASFAPVLAALAPALATGPDCVRLDVTVVDGRAGAGRATELGSDLWIADDASWRSVDEAAPLAEEGVAGSGTVLATSPLYLVSDRGTAERVAAAGGSWLGLSTLLTDGSGTTAALRDPAGSGDGMMAAGAIGEAVWIDRGMDASAEALATALPSIRTVAGDGAALPERDGEVGLVPEYALLPALAEGGADRVVLAPADHTALLRHTFLPTAGAAADPATTAVLERLLAALTGPDGAAAITAAGLRLPDGAAPATAPADLPAVTAAPFEVLGPHHVDHVLATWYPEDRRSDVLVAVDVSGSMADVAPGGDRPLIDLVREGVGELGAQLPDDSEFALWEFGSLIDGPSDSRVLLPRATLTPEHRGAVAAVTGGLAPRRTGTGLYDTVFAAYVAARDGYRPGMPNHVVVFTDGRNRDDLLTITPEQLTEGLVAAQDPARPVQLTVITFGPEPEADVLEAAIDPVDGYVDRIATAREVGAVFMHVAAGGVHD